MRDCARVVVWSQCCDVLRVVPHRNPGVRTIEADLMTAFVAAGLVDPLNATKQAKVCVCCVAVLEVWKGR